MRPLVVQPIRGGPFRVDLDQCPIILAVYSPAHGGIDEGHAFNFVTGFDISEEWTTSAMRLPISLDPEEFLEWLDRSVPTSGARLSKKIAEYINLRERVAEVARETAAKKIIEVP